METWNGDSPHVQDSNNEFMGYKRNESQTHTQTDRQHNTQNCVLSAIAIKNTLQPVTSLIHPLSNLTPRIFLSDQK